MTKKLYITLLMICCAFFACAQSSLINVNGYVYKKNTNLPYPNHRVCIIPDLHFSDTIEVYTQPTGYYSASFAIDSNAHFKVLTYNYANIITDTIILYNGTELAFKVNFYLDTNNVLPDCEIKYNWQIITGTFNSIAFSPDDTLNTNYITWTWQFGDGTYSAQSSPQHIFNHTGTYYVCLDLYDSLHHCTSHFCDSITLSAPPCTSSFVYTSNNALFSFQNTSFAVNPIYTWSFGDNSNLSSTNAEHLYTAPGLYEVCLSVADRFSDCVTQNCDTITVLNHNPCEALFDFYISNVRDTMVTLHLSDNSTGNINRWSWNVDNNFLSNNQNATLNLHSDDTAVICLYVYNAQEAGFCNDTYCDTVFLKSDEIVCNTDFLIIQDTACKKCATFKALPNKQYPNSIVLFDWQISDNTTSSFNTLIHEFAANGTYSVCLKISYYDTLHGLIVCENTICKSITVYDPPCSSDFFWMQIPQSFGIQFTSQAVGNIAHYYWDFGDGYFSSEANPLHTYSDTLVHNVCLTVKDTGICEDTRCYAVKISAGTFECNPHFNIVQNPANCGQSCYAFLDLSDSDGQIIDWLWAFGDGNFSASQYPYHTYAAPGSYNVCLSITARNFLGQLCNNTFCTTLVVSAFPKYNLGGQVFSEVYPINEGKAYLYRTYPNDEVEPVDTAHFTYLGYYYFYQLPVGDYFVKIHQTKNGEIVYNNFSPTYTGDVLHWQNAHVVELSANYYDADVHLIKTLSISGPCKINGRVYVPHATQNSNTLLEGIQILLMNTSGQAYNYAFTDNNGRFAFSGLSYGTYKLQAEITGYYTQPVWITLTSQNSTDSAFVPIPAINILSLDENKDQTDLHFLSPYPIPAEDFINLAYNPEIQETLVISIYTLYGQKVSSVVHTFSKFNSLKQIPLSELSSGLYLLKAETVASGKTKCFRIIKK